MKIRFIYPFLFLIFPIFIAAGTTGKIKGLVLDKETNSPIIGANVFLESTTLGTVTDENGNYFIINVPPGVYTSSELYWLFNRNNKKYIGFYRSFIN